MLRDSKKLSIVTVGIVAFFTYLLLRGLYLGYLAPAHVWIAGVAVDFRELAMFAAWIFDFVVVAVPVCFLFGVPFGLSWRYRPVVSGSFIAGIYVVTEWVYYCFLFKANPPISSVIAVLYFVQDVLVIVFFVLAVLWGTKLQKPSNQKLHPTSYVGG